MSTKFLGGICLILLAYILTGWGIKNLFNFDILIVKGMIYSGLLATLFALITFFSTVIVARQAKEKFNKVFFSTMGIRFFLMLGIIIIILTQVSLDHFTFLVSLFILYFLLQIWEILIIHRYLNQD